MGGTSNPLARETRELLRQNTKFFSGLVAISGNGDGEIPIEILGKDPEARVERSVLGSGEVAVDFVYPVDNNDKTSDGRIYLKDRFLFDATEQTFKKFERSLQYNGLGKGAWREWLKKAQGAAQPSAEEAKAFALTVGRSYSRPLSSDDPKILQAMVAQKAYLTKAGDLVRAEKSDYKLLSSDPQNRYHLTVGGNGWELTTYLTLKRPGDLTSAILLREKFFLSRDGKTLQRHERSWEAAAGANAGVLKDLLAKLSQKALPSQTEAQSYLAALLPALTPALLPEPAAPAPSAPKPTNPPAQNTVNPPAPAPAPPPPALPPKAAGPLFFVFNADAKSNRDDTLAIYADQSKKIVQGKFLPHIKSEKLQLLRFEMTIHVHPGTGSVQRVEFNVREYRSNFPDAWLRDQLETIAKEVHRSFRFQPSVEGSIKATFTLKPG